MKSIINTVIIPDDIEPKLFIFHFFFKTRFKKKTEQILGRWHYNSHLVLQHLSTWWFLLLKAKYNDWHTHTHQEYNVGLFQLGTIKLKHTPKDTLSCGWCRCSANIVLWRALGHQACVRMWLIPLQPLWYSPKISCYVSCGQQTGDCYYPLSLVSPFLWRSRRLSSSQRQERGGHHCLSVSLSLGTNSAFDCFYSRGDMKELASKMSNTSSPGNVLRCLF